MERYIAPVDVNHTNITRQLFANGVTTGDKIELLNPENPSDSLHNELKNSITNIKTILNGSTDGVTVTTQTIPTNTFEKTVTNCSNIILNGIDPVVCLGVGVTDINTPLLIAATAHKNNVTRTMMYSDLNATGTEIPFPPLSNSFPKRASETFTVIAENKSETITLHDLATETNTSRATVSRHVTALESNGFVKTTNESKAKTASVTLLGELTHRNIQHGNNQ